MNQSAAFIPDENSVSPELREALKKASSKVCSRFDERLRIFAKNAFHPILNNHPLTGDRAGQWSINITGDWCAIYVFVEENEVVFIDLDTHSNLYK
jgi:addiction module RelE/StbE family toxin